MTPLISICLTSNRPYLWKDTYETINQFSDDITFEMVLTSPNDLEESFPSNFRHIKTGNVKVPQCIEIAIRHAQGKIIVIFGDDIRFQPTGGISHLYKEYDRLCNKRGDNDLVLMPQVRDPKRTCDCKFANVLDNAGPVVGLGSALFDRELLSKIGGQIIDIRFLGSIWDSDLGMRFHEIGVEFVQYLNICHQEIYDSRMTYRLHKSCSSQDLHVLHDLWVRETKEGEQVPSEDVWGYMIWVKLTDANAMMPSDKKHVLSKKRLTEVIGYKDEDILTKSQGPKASGHLSWD